LRCVVCAIVEPVVACGTRFADVNEGLQPVFAWIFLNGDMQPSNERRKHLRQSIMLPLRVTEKEPTGRLLFEGGTVNVGAGGVYFRTAKQQGIRIGTPVHIVIDIPPEMFQFLPFGGLRGSGEIVRIDQPGVGESSDDSTSEAFGVAVHMTSRLHFDSEARISKYEPPPRRSDWPGVRANLA
jgi:hypothetical protein